MSVWGFTLDLTALCSPTLTSINCCAWRQLHAVRLQRWGMSHWDEWGLNILAWTMSRDDAVLSWVAARPQILVPAFSLCHFTKMWVSLVNTLNPRPREHIMTSCSVGNRLHMKKLGLANACQTAFHLCSTQKDLFCTSLLVAEDNYLSKFLFKLNHFIEHNWEMNFTSRWRR